METGSHLRELWAAKRGIALCLVLALLAATWSVSKVSVSPPGLKLRKLEIAAASTQILIDTPNSKILNLRATYVAFASLTSRADLLGTLITSPIVMASIARKMNISPSQIQASAPITANVPRALIEPGSGASAMDIIASPDRYKLQIQADPTVPILRIYTQAPSTSQAIALAQASVVGLRDFLSKLADSQSVPASHRVQVREFGTPHGGVVNGGAWMQIAGLTFLVLLVLSSYLMLFVVRMRRNGRRVSLTAGPQL